MQVEKLKAALDPWARAETWHTNHRADEARFHAALASALAEGGLPLDAHVAYEAIIQVVGAHHAGFDPTYLQQVAEALAQRAEQISYYLLDTRGGT